MAVTVDDIVKVAFQWFISGRDEVINVHTFQVNDLTGVTNDADFMADLAALALSSIYDNIVGNMANQVVGATLSGINLTKGEVLPPVDQNIDGGNSAADIVPHQATALICLNGVEPRRQGRSYLPPFAENNIDDDGEWGATTVTALTGYAINLLAPIDAGALGVTRVVSNPTGTNFFIPSNATIVVAPRTQRRRTLGRGS